ncbi:MAG: NAD-dependent epimerase/dehydratase family protein [Thermomicrobiales bacterium]
MKVVLTGAAGVIGRAVREHLGDRYEFVSITRKPTEFTNVIGDISDFDAIRPAFDGADAVVHLAASTALDSPWSRCCPTTSSAHTTSMKPRGRPA